MTAEPDHYQRRIAALITRYGELALELEDGATVAGRRGYVLEELALIDGCIDRLKRKAHKAAGGWPSASGQK